MPLHDTSRRPFRLGTGRWWTIGRSFMRRSELRANRSGWNPGLSSKRCSMCHAPVSESFPKMFGADWQKASDTFYAAFEARHLEALTLLPGAETCLDCLEAARISRCGRFEQERRLSSARGRPSRLDRSVRGPGGCGRRMPRQARCRTGQDGPRRAGRDSGWLEIRIPIYARRAMPACARQSCPTPADLHWI